MPTLNPVDLSRWYVSALSLLAAPIASFAQPSPPVSEAVYLTPVHVFARREGDIRDLDQQPGGIGVVHTLGQEELAAHGNESIEQIISREGLGTLDANSSLGTGSGLSMRGFTVSVQSASNLTTTGYRLDGHADIAYRFLRDMSTVERVQVLGGLDSTFIGTGAPGGTLQYIGKTAQGRENLVTSFTLGSDGLRRTVLDGEKHFGPLQARIVLAEQEGQHTVEGMPTNRKNGLLSLVTNTPAGNLRLDLEQQVNHAPYVFGTVYDYNQFWYDRPYVSPQSRADRQFQRAALYWDKSLSAATTVRAYWQTARQHRDESLVGFWDIRAAGDLWGYYRTVQADAAQMDYGATLDSLQHWGGMDHHLSLGVQHQWQTLDFNGPQSIDQYVIGLDQPQWPINLGALTLVPRTLRERYAQTGYALADRVSLTSSLEARLGWRRTVLDVQTAQNGVPMTTAADLSHDNVSAGLAWRRDAANQAWLARTESFQPNRGLLRLGGYMPPQLGVQWELGYLHEVGTDRFSASLFRIDLANLPGVDPIDKNYIIPVGAIRSQGLAAHASTEWAGWSLRLNGNWQHSRVVVPVSATQGSYMTGTPGYFGSLRAGRSLGGIRGWLQPVWNGNRPGNGTNSFVAPGYVRWDAGVEGTVSPRVRWAFTAENLLDKRYVQALSAANNVWQGPRRRFNLMVTLSF